MIAVLKKYQFILNPFCLLISILYFHFISALFYLGDKFNSGVAIAVIVYSFLYLAGMFSIRWATTPSVGGIKAFAKRSLIALVLSCAGLTVLWAPDSDGIRHLHFLYICNLDSSVYVLPFFLISTVGALILQLFGKTRMKFGGFLACLVIYSIFRGLFATAHFDGSFPPDWWDVAQPEPRISGAID